MSRPGYTPFGRPITLDNGGLVKALYPEDSLNREWLIVVTNSDGEPVDEIPVALGAATGGPSVDDVIKLEAETKRAIERYDK